jgi:hypothetical protein
MRPSARALVSKRRKLQRNTAQQRYAVRYAGKCNDAKRCNEAKRREHDKFSWVGGAAYSPIATWGRQCDLRRGAWVGAARRLIQTLSRKMQLINIAG